MAGTRSDSSLTTMTPKQMFSLWWQEKWVRGLVLAISPIGLVDAVYTVLLFQLHGPEYEYNPIVQAALTSDWWFVWILIDIFSFVIFAMVAGSYYLHTRSSIFGNHTGWLSILVGVRVGAVFYNAFLYYGDPIPTFWGAFTTLMSAIIVSRLLSRERDISVRGFKWYWKSKFNRLKDRFLTRGISRQSEQIVEVASRPDTPKEGVNGKVWLKRAGYISMAVVVFVSMPFILVTVGMLTGGIFWSERYGGNVFWNELSGTTFVAGFFVILILLMIMMSFILKAFGTTSKSGPW